MLPKPVPAGRPKNVASIQSWLKWWATEVVNFASKKNEKQEDPAYYEKLAKTYSEMCAMIEKLWAREH